MTLKAASVCWQSAEIFPSTVLAEDFMAYSVE
jgi:hypothetical protein